MLDKKKLRFNRHSENKKNFKNCDVYIVDSYGENKSFYKISNVVFLGGSLVSKGGQNPLEALRFGCNILHGNYTFNFKDGSSAQARFTYVYKKVDENNWIIVEHHSSLLP